MNIKRKSQILLTIALFLSMLIYFLNIYPPAIANIGKNASIGFFIFISAGFLVSYFAFFTWPTMSSLVYVGVSLLFIGFFNLFFIVTRYSSFAPLGIILMLAFLAGVLITNRKNRNKNKLRN